MVSWIFIINKAAVWAVDYCCIWPDWSTHTGFKWHVTQEFSISSPSLVTMIQFYDSDTKPPCTPLLIMKENVPGKLKNAQPSCLPDCYRQDYTRVERRVTMVRVVFHMHLLKLGTTLRPETWTLLQFMRFNRRHRNKLRRSKAAGIGARKQYLIATIFLQWGPHDPAARHVLALRNEERASRGHLVLPL